MRVAVVVAEPRRLRENRRDRETGAMHRTVVALEIFRRHPEIIGNGLAEAGHDVLFQRRDDAVAKPWPFNLPVHIAKQVRHRAQHIETVAALRRETAVGGGRPVKIEREICLLYTSPSPRDQ